jgi:hypothetical protein
VRTKLPQVPPINPKPNECTKKKQRALLIIKSFKSKIKQKNNSGLKMEMKLLKGERVVLENSPFGSSRKVTLTNKRLTIQKKEGLFFSFWIIEEEFPLDTIEEAYLRMVSLSGTSSLWLKLKDGKLIQVPIGIGSVEELGTLEAAGMTTDYALKIKIVNDRWVNAINNQLNKNRIRAANKRYKQLS